MLFSKLTNFLKLASKEDRECIDPIVEVKKKMFTAVSLSRAVSYGAVRNFSQNELV